MFKMLYSEKSTLYFNYNKDMDIEPDDNVSLWMEPCTPNTSDWWRTLPNPVNMFKPQEMFDWMKKKRLNVSNIETYKTRSRNMKTCPGITGLFKSTILLKAPVDITIFIQDNEDNKHHHIINQSELPNLLPVQSHGTHQFANQGSHWSQYRNLKFCFPFKVKSSHPYIFAQPYWHNHVPFDVPPGGVFGKFHNHQDLNLNVLYKMNPTLEYNHFTVKKGTVLGYAIFPYPVNLKYDKSIPQDVRLSQTKSGLLN